MNWIEILQALHELFEVLPEVDDDYEVGMRIAKRVWIASYDVEESIQQSATS
jgi:hypothetical protein